MLAWRPAERRAITVGVGTGWALGGSKPSQSRQGSSDAGASAGKTVVGVVLRSLRVPTSRTAPEPGPGRRDQPGPRQWRRNLGFSWGLESRRALMRLASTGFEKR